MSVTDAIERGARRFLKKRTVAFRRWWAEEGEPRARKARPGDDPLLVVKIDPRRSYILLGIISGFLLLMVGRAFWLQCGISTD